MDLLLAELYKTRKIALVAKAYYTSDKQSIVVELVVNPSIFGLTKQNLLFFPSETFSSEKVNERIVQLIAQAARGV